MKYTTIPVSHALKETIKEYGHKGETYEEILTRIVSFAKEKHTEQLLSKIDTVSIEEAITQAKKKWRK